MLSLVRFALGVAAIVATVQVRADQVYDWTGGAAGYSGQITLDSNNNASGSIADIVSATITTPEGTFAFDAGSAVLLSNVFSWYPTQITNMWIDWNPGLNAGFGENWDGAGSNFVGSNISNYSVDFSGSWTAESSTVPDGGATISLLGAAIIGLAALRRRSAK